MHVLTILAFAVLFWEAEDPGRWLAVGPDDWAVTLCVSLGTPLVVAIAAIGAARRAQRLLLRYPEAAHIGQLFHHRTTLLLRIAALGGFTAATFLTQWPHWFRWGRGIPALQIAGDLIVLAPFVVGQIAVWWASFSFESAQHVDAVFATPGVDSNSERRCSLRRYMDFQLRHHLLVVAVPLVLILFFANVFRGYEEELSEAMGWTWTADALLGLTAGCVFVLAPLLLRHIWRTHPLEPGPLRSQLQALCQRIGLHCRDILVWNSDGMMINAAVMGLIPRVRYVMLSDALLDTMNTQQIEAVFGHEAGHVRHRHIQYFLLFAFVGWLVVAGVMELLARGAGAGESASDSTALLIPVAGVGASVLVWGVGFGWLSRKFERQADMFGAQCAMPDVGGCTLPCSVHLDRLVAADGRGAVVRDRVCMTGASVFASALDRVAVLNGIPHEERSWRHSSIGSRIRFLMAMAADPGLAGRFSRSVQRTKQAMALAAVIGAALAGYYGIWIAKGNGVVLAASH